MAHRLLPGLLRGNRLPVHRAIREFVLHGLRYSDVTQALTILRTAIRGLLDKVLALPDAEDVIAAQLLPDAKSQRRLPLVLDRIRGLIPPGTEWPMPPEPVFGNASGRRANINRF